MRSYGQKRSPNVSKESSPFRLRPSDGGEHWAWVPKPKALGADHLTGKGRQAHYGVETTAQDTNTSSATEQPVVRHRIRETRP